MTQPGIPDVQLAVTLNRACEAIDTGIQQATGKFEELVEQVRRWSWTMPPAVLLWVRDRLAACREMMGVVLDKAQQALDRRVPVLSLISTGHAWLGDVREPISRMSSRARGVDLDLPEWSGDAASGYLAKADGQRVAIDDLAERATFISSWLVGIAMANIEYAIELAKLVTQLVSRLTEAVTEVGGVVALPWAIDALAEAVGELLNVGLGSLRDIAERLVDTIGNVRDVHARISDHTSLPGGGWPEAVRG